MMIEPEAYLVRENDREITFAHRPRYAALLLLIGAGIVYYFFFSGAVEDQTARWTFTAAGAFFAAVGLVSALWRRELRLDLLTRTYTGRRGFWPNPKLFRGFLDEMEGVILTSRTGLSDGSAATVWTVSFGFKVWHDPVKVMESQSEVEARRKFELYAKKLRVPAIDRTGSAAERPGTGTGGTAGP